METIAVWFSCGAASAVAAKKRAGFSQKEIASKYKMSPSAISNIKTGKTHA